MQRLLLTALVAMAVPNAPFAQSYTLDPNRLEMVAPNLLQVIPRTPPSPATVPAEQVTTGPQPTYTCPQALAQLQWIIGQPAAVAYQVTYRPLYISEPDTRKGGPLVRGELNIYINQNQVIYDMRCTLS